ncbi:predicted protein [Botrytis cinerea T4]|uniref:Uncharacterized protein n=1 Tax=Botryotinia fuckeliana (strain T4) TaxID=999810 RepID=G2Y1T5_BOTF4|nr:predicted protein [Botrytis cinerea T4]
MTLYKPFEGTTQEELKLHRPKSPDFLLCHVCGLNSSLQEHEAYFSHVKVSMNSSRARSHSRGASNNRYGTGRVSGGSTQIYLNKTRSSRWRAP